MDFAFGGGAQGERAGGRGLDLRASVWLRQVMVPLALTVRTSSLGPYSIAGRRVGHARALGTERLAGLARASASCGRSWL